jgi:tRNA(Ile2) C34 agmatinyltransferase TiaS
MWIVIALIVILAVAAALSIGAWLSLLFEAAETPICPRCGGRTRKLRMSAVKAAEQMEFYRCRECGNDPTPESARQWAKSRLEPPL